MSKLFLFRYDNSCCYNHWFTSPNKNIKKLAANFLLLLTLTSCSTLDFCNRITSKVLSTNVVYNDYKIEFAYERDYAGLTEQCSVSMSTSGFIHE